MNFKSAPVPGDGEGAAGDPPGDHLLDRNPDTRTMRLQKLKHMVEANAYRVDPQVVAVALLLRVDPRRDVFTGLLRRPDGQSPADPGVPCDPAA